MKLILLQYLVQGDVEKNIVTKITCLCEKFHWDHFLRCHRLCFTLRDQHVTHFIGEKTKLHKYEHIIYDGKRDFMMINIC